MALFRCGSDITKTVPAGFIMVGSRSDGAITLGLNTVTTPNASSTGFVVSNQKGTLSISSGTIGVRKVYADGTFDASATSAASHDLSDCVGCAINTTSTNATITFTA